VSSQLGDKYAAEFAVDGNPSTYWESRNGVFPQSLTLDLGTSTPVASMVLKLPPSSAWGARIQTLSVFASADGAAWSTLVRPAGYRFDPATGNTVTIALPATGARYLRLEGTSNSGWQAVQISEVEVYAP
jgi:hypothetical protein